MPPSPAGRRDQWIMLLAPAHVRDDHGGEIERWDELGRVKAMVRFGSSAERREAAQESAIQSATFRIPANAITRTLTARHALRFQGSDWDISNVVVLSIEIEITAVRKAA